MVTVNHKGYINLERVPVVEYPLCVQYDRLILSTLDQYRDIMDVFY